MKQLLGILIVLLATALAGCASPGSIVPGSASVADLTSKLGKPADKRSNPQGGEIWDYTYGPEGTATWRYTIDAGGVVRSAEQLLTLERLYKVVPGETTEAGVIELLGKPRMVSRYRHETVWDWRAQLVVNRGYFIVRFGSDGRALGTGVLEDMAIDGDRGP